LVPTTVAVADGVLLRRLIADGTQANSAVST